MGKVAIVTDSIACLSNEMVGKYAIRVVPVNILFEGKTYRNGVDISISEAYKLLERATKHFSTSPASPQEYLEAYREQSAWAESILGITISSKLSTVYNMANVAREKARQELPHVTIELLDSQTAAAGEGLIVLAAAQAAAEGKGLAEVIEVAESVRRKVNVIAVMETVRHAYRTGRIPKTASRIGAMLNIKPIFTISEGTVHFAGATRSKQRGVDQLLKKMRKEVGVNPVHVAVMHADVPEEGKKLKDRVSAEFNCVELWLTEFTPVMGYAAGRGILAIAFYPEA